MTWEEMQADVRRQIGKFGQDQHLSEHIKWKLYFGMSDFCRRTECSIQTSDYTISYENGAWRREYPLPGYQVTVPASPYSDSTHAGANFRKALRVYLDGDLIRQTSLDRITDLTGTTAPIAGTDNQGENIAINWDGTGGETSDQYWYLFKNKFLGLYPTKEEAVSLRLIYVWVPDIQFKTAINYPSGNESRIEVSARFPETWHEVPILYALSKLKMDDKEYQVAREYRNEYEMNVREALKEFRDVAHPVATRGVYF